MKKKLITIILGGLAVVGCSLDKSYLNGPDAASFPSTKTEVESGVFAAYKSFTQLSAQSTPFIGLQDNATDIGASRINVNNYNDQQKGMVSISNSWVTSVYKWIFKTNGRINLVLDNIDRAKDDMTETEYNQYKAELLCIRAYIYNWGCQLYGDLPYIDHTLSINDTYSRAPKAEVINNILTALDDNLIDALPDRWAKSNYGYTRIGRAAAYGLKARINLDWAADNTVTEATYANAQKYAAKAIEIAESAGYTFTAVDITPCGKDHTFGEPDPTPIFGVSGAKNGDEWIWGFEFNSAIDGNHHVSEYYSAPRTIGGCAYFSPTQSFIDAFQCTDGKKITESSLYDWQNPWENRDPRLDLYCIRTGSRVLGMEFSIDKTRTKVHDYNSNTDITNSSVTGNKNEYGANGKKGPCGYLWRKYLDMEEFQANNLKFNTRSICVIGYPLMRLPELYLIRAEADIELNQNLAEAQSDINKIRARVSMPAVKETSQDGLRSALRYERMVELCNEGFRWYDIRRWGIAGDVMKGTLLAPADNGTVSNAKPTIDENWHSTYTGATWDGKEQNLRKFLEFSYNPSKDVVWPIPEAEIIANPNMTQNNGYGNAGK